MRPYSVDGKFNCRMGSSKCDIRWDGAFTLNLDFCKRSNTKKPRRFQIVGAFRVCVKSYEAGTIFNSLSVAKPCPLRSLLTTILR